jgi:hypothetical protein
MFRLISRDLEAWYHRRSRKPLLLRGARQVGKTWAVRELARSEGVPLVEINFELRPQAKQAFVDLDPEKILRTLSLLGFHTASPGTGILFLDEIQDCPQAIASLRYFHENMPELPVVGSGSLLEFAMDEQAFSTPVGRVDFLWMHPMGFSEFLRSRGDGALADGVDTFDIAHPLPEIVHRRALEELRGYLFCGGMPEAVKAWTAGADAQECRRIHWSLLQGYRQDFRKYAPKVKANLAESLFVKAPGLMGGRFKYAHVDSDVRSAEVKNAVEALEKAGIVRRVRHSPGQGLPLSVDENERISKLVFLDVGLAHASLGIDAELVQNPDLLAIHRGAVAEQFVAQELLATAPPDHPSDLHFWVREATNSQAEVDYLVALGSKVVPVEVKSGATGRLKSLRSFLSSHPRSPVGVRLHAGAPLREADILHLPLYAVGAMRRMLD